MEKKMVESAGILAAAFCLAVHPLTADTYAYKVQYLESTPGGGQYIDTGVTPTGSTTFTAMYEYIAFSGETSNYGMIAGLAGTGSSNTGRYYPVSLNGNMADTAYLRRERYVLAGDQGTKNHGHLTRHTIIFNDANHKVTVDGTELAKTLPGDTFAAQTKTCFLFAASSSGGNPQYHSAARIYRCAFIDGSTGTTLRRFIPVVDTNGKPAMFDEEHGKLYYNKNAGGDDFVVGPPAESWNAAPYFVEYLESGGRTNYMPWIDTGHIVTTNTETRIGYRFTDETQVNYATLCGVMALKYYPVSVHGASALKERHCYGATGQFNAEYPVLQNHEVLFNRGKNVFVDGRWLGSFSQTFDDSAYPMYVFATAYNNSGDPGYFAKARVRHMEIYESGALQKAFVPAIDANGVACLYDLQAASNPYHYNMADKYADDGTTERNPFLSGRIISHTVPLDVSAKTDFTCGMNVLPFAERPSYGTVFTLDGTTAAAYDAAVRSDGVWLVEKDAGAAATAVWSGGGRADDVTDADNWICRNAAGAVLAGVLPGERTVIGVTGSTSIPLAAGAMPGCASIVLSGTVTLAADCDWRGLGTVVIPDGVTIDLNGHNLRLAGFATLFGETATVTDSTSGKGELHVAVAENDVLVNDSVALTGSLKFVKEGAGTFVAQKTGQTYSGGTEVAAGILRRGDANGSYATPNDVGGRTQNFRIASGAAFDINGAHTTDFIYTLDGGTLTNCRPNTASGNRYVGATVNVAADSAVAGQSFGFLRSGFNAITVNLGDKALSVNMDSGASFWLVNVTFSGAGTLAVNSGTLMTVMKGNHPPSAGSDMTLAVGASGKMNLEAPLTVRNFRSASSAYGGTNVVTVLGTFRPTAAGANGFPNIRIANGATIDLSGMEGTLAFGGKISFEDNAVVAVNLGGRKPSSTVPSISWTVAPANLASVKFVDAADGKKLGRRHDGVYALGGLALSFR